MAPKQLSEAHKKAMAEGRQEGQAVKAYLDALEQHRPRRGRKRTQESIAKRLAVIDQTLPEASSLKRLQLVQERRDLQAEAAAMDGATPDLAALESDFVRVARSYGERKGIAYATWRELGVSSETLERAGITRGASSPHSPR